MHCWWVCLLVQLLWKTIWRFLKKKKKKLGIKLTYDPAYVMGIYAEKTIIEKGTCIPVFIVALFKIARI